MDINELRRNAVARGHWLYAGEVPSPVWIVPLPYDYWFRLAEADGQLEPNEQPETPGESGVLYYVNFASGTPIRGPAHKTAETAKRWAESQVQGPITWQD